MSLASSWLLCNISFELYTSFILFEYCTYEMFRNKRIDWLIDCFSDESNELFSYICDQACHQKHQRLASISERHIRALECFKMGMWQSSRMTKVIERFPALWHSQNMNNSQDMPHKIKWHGILATRSLTSNDWLGGGSMINQSRLIWSAGHSHWSMMGHREYKLTLWANQRCSLWKKFHQCSCWRWKKLQKNIWIRFVRDVMFWSWTDTKLRYSSRQRNSYSAVPVF